MKNVISRCLAVSAIGDTRGSFNLWHGRRQSCCGIAFWGQILRAPSVSMRHPEDTRSLACRRSADRTLRHQDTPNDLMSMTSCDEHVAVPNVPTAKVPVGFKVITRKRPNELTQIPWQTECSVTSQLPTTWLSTICLPHHRAPESPPEGAVDRKLLKHQVSDSNTRFHFTST